MTEAGTGTVNSKGQVTVPKSVRRALGIEEGDRLVLDVEGHRVLVRKVPCEILTTQFGRQEPWKIRGALFRRRLGDEWVARGH